MSIRDDNDITYDRSFFSSRGTRNPRAQRRIIAQVETLSKGKVSQKGNAYKFTKTGARVDLDGIVARSGWEADTMRVLKFHKIDFLFEPVEFRFPPDAKGRTSAYLPDIYLTKTDEYIEVKGYLDARGRNKLRKFKKHYPEEFSRLTVVISKSNKANKAFFNKLGVKNILFYEHLSSLYKNKIAAWEGR